MSKPALFFVFTEPGSDVSDDEYNDWYDNEHIPARVPIPSFTSWSRWVAEDDRKPSYLTLYDLSNADALTTAAYKNLASTRSEREKGMLERIALIDRRTYENVEVPIPPRKGPTYGMQNPPPFLLVILVDVPEVHEDDFNRWYNEEHIDLLSESPQWMRSTRWTLLNSGVSGKDESLRPKGPGGAHKYLTLHEYTGLDALKSKEFEQAVSTEWTKRVQGYAIIFERRVFRLLRKWERP